MDYHNQFEIENLFYLDITPSEKKEALNRLLRTKENAMIELIKKVKDTRSKLALIKTDQEIVTHLEKEVHSDHITSRKKKLVNSSTEVEKTLSAQRNDIQEYLREIEIIKSLISET